MPISITTPYNPITDTNMELVRAAYIEKLGGMTPEHQHEIGKGILLLALLLAECNNGMSAEKTPSSEPSRFSPPQRLQRKDSVMDTPKLDALLNLYPVGINSARNELAALKARVVSLEKALNQKADECRAEWIRAENAEAELAAWREFAWHQTWCRECGETSPRQCSEGFALWEKADPTITKEVD